MTLIEKKQKLAALVADARQKLDAKDMEAYNKIDADIDALSAEIKADEKLIERENALKSISDPAHLKPIPENTKTGKITESPEYKNAFFKAVREGKNALNSEERKLFQNVMSAGVDTAGGYLVMPVELENSIKTVLGQTVAMRRLATVISTTADRKIPLATSFGAASWIDENGVYPKVDDGYEVKILGSHKAGKIILVSRELLNDSEFDLQSLISNSFGRAFAEAEEAAYISGDGNDKPTGVLVDAQTGITTASATVLTSDELLDLFYSLKAGYRQNASFLINDSTEKVIRKLKNATTGDYMWQPGLTIGQPNTLLGRPVETSDSMPTIAAAAKIIAFGDFKQYMIKDTTGMRMQVLDQLYAENGQVGFQGDERTDGKLIVAEAVKLLKMKA